MSVLAPSFPIEAAPLDMQAAHETPPLLEYRADIDQDVAFIPKTVGGFALGALSMGIMLDLGETLWIHADQPFETLLPGLILRLAFMIGVIGVSSSLLLVGLKVRADHNAEPLYGRHWLNSLGTGAVYACMMYVPLVFVNHEMVVNRFIAATALMAMMVFPAVAAKWTVGPYKERRPAM